MKILQLVTRRQYRGAEVFAANLSEELIELGHEIIFVGLYKNPSIPLEVIGAKHHDLSEKPDGAFSVSIVRKLVSFIKTEKPDIIQCNGSDTLKYMVAASFFISKTPITYRNISMISVWLNGKAKNVLYKNMFKRIVYVTSVGKEAAEDFAVALNYPKSKISVIRRGIPLKELKADESANLFEEFGLKKQDKIVVHVGNFSPEKNHEFLLRIFSKIKNQHSDIKLLLVGNGSLYEEIQTKIKAMDLSEVVYMAGFRKDIPEILAASHCFVLSSKVEGVPGVILEAAAQKVPAVATNVGGVQEVLVDHETGFVINDFDEQVFTEKLLEIVMNEDLRQRMGENAYRMVKEEFNPQRNAKKFEELYQRLIREAKA